MGKILNGLMSTSKKKVAKRKMRNVHKEKHE